MLIVNWDTVAVDGVIRPSLNGVAVEEGGTWSVRTILDEVVDLDGNS